MLELYSKLDCTFTDADKEACVAIVYKMHDIILLGRKEGILAFEDTSKFGEGVFLRTTLELCVYVCDKGYIAAFLATMLLSEGHTGPDLLSRLIMSEAVMQILEGNDPYYVAYICGAMLGGRHMQQIMDDLYPTYKSREELYEEICNLVADEALPECAELEKIFSQIHDVTIQRILREVDQSTLRTFLYGCSRDTVLKVLKNISLTNCSLILKDWPNTDISNDWEKERIAECQNRILKIIRILCDNGEIIIKS